ncbi:hypothetical protein [Pedobacter sp. NJ-S-72]
MNYNKIILAGGNGYLGGVLAQYYRGLASEVIILSRTEKAADGNIKTLVWNGVDDGEWSNSLDGADLLINLCGKNVKTAGTRRKTRKRSLLQGCSPPGYWD